MVSVIIPMYNREKTIETAVKSVLEQTYGKLEVVIVDDCSTDNSVDVVKNISDERVRLLTCEENGGACKARNIGIENAKGEIIAFQDSDDYWHKDKLEKSLQALEVSGAEFVFSSFSRFQKDAPENGVDVLPRYNLNKEKDKMAKLLCINCVSTQTIVAKKEVFENIRFDERLPRFQDWELALQVLRSGFKMFYIEEPLVDCYITEGSITSDGRKAVRAFAIIGEKYKEYYRKNKIAKETFYYKTAVYMEKSGLNGSQSFKRAYQARKNKGMLLRYMLAKIKIYKYLCILLDNVFEYNNRKKNRK
jgi:glycosyltransferase involved in cell wall biosynthesis